MYTLLCFMPLYHILEKSRLEDQWGKKEKKPVAGIVTSGSDATHGHGIHSNSNHTNINNPKISERLQPIGASAENTHEEAGAGQSQFTA